MTKKISAGILVYRIQDDRLEVLLAHPGGPFWANKDDGAWSIFKGEVDGGEDLLEAARREFKEETKHDVPQGELIYLGYSDESKAKTIHAWAVQADFDAAAIESNHFTMEWPPKSGRIQSFPENDRAAWFEPDVARQKLFKGQPVFVDRLMDVLDRRRPGF